MSHLSSAVNSGVFQQNLRNETVSGIQAVKAGGQSSLCSSKLEKKKKQFNSMGY